MSWMLKGTLAQLVYLPAVRHYFRDVSSVGLERMLDRHEVTCSTHVRPTLAGGERMLDRQEVSSSNLLSPTYYLDKVSLLKINSQTAQ